MEQETIFLGLDGDDLWRVAEVLALSVVAITIILFVVRPLVQLTFTPGANFSWPGYIQIVRTDLQFVRTNLGRWLKWLAIGIVAITAAIIVVPPVCEGRKDACFVWADALVRGVILVFGVYMLGRAAFRIRRQGLSSAVRNQTFWVEAFFAVFVAYPAMNEWEKVFGGNCSQALMETTAPVATLPVDPTSPFPPGTRVSIKKLGWQIAPADSGYCVDVGPVPGTRGTVVAHARSGSNELRLMINWDEQPFREHSWVGFVLDRRPVLKPFVSRVPPSYFEL